jgi:hypothetical protein
VDLPKQWQVPGRPDHQRGGFGAVGGGGDLGLCSGGCGVLFQMDTNGRNFKLLQLSRVPQTARSITFSWRWTKPENSMGLRLREATLHCAKIPSRSLLFAWDFFVDPSKHRRQPLWTSNEPRHSHAGRTFADRQLISQNVTRPLQIVHIFLRSIASNATAKGWVAINNPPNNQDNKHVDASPKPERRSK